MSNFISSSIEFRPVRCRRRCVEPCGGGDWPTAVARWRRPRRLYRVVTEFLTDMEPRWPCPAAAVVVVLVVVGLLAANTTACSVGF